MRIDPLDVFAQGIGSVPARAFLAWITATLGAFAPVVIGYGVEALDAIRWHFLLLPFFLFLQPFISGWWGVVAFPLLLVFLWSLILFLRGDVESEELVWLFLLPYLISIKISGDAWPWAASVVAIAIVFAGWLRSRSSRYNPA